MGHIRWGTLSCHTDIIAKRTNLKKTSKIEIKKYIANSTLWGFEDGLKLTDFLHLLHDGQIPKEEDWICTYC
jgi:hypothetical protein